MPRSWKRGKVEIREYLLAHFPRESRILDVGPGEGTYYNLLHDDFPNMDAVEVHEPYIKQFDLERKYGRVYHSSICDFDNFDGYDIVLMGDVLEHITVEEAQKAIARMKNVSEIMVAVPFENPQGSAGGVASEIHVQDDLTRENFLVRYPELKELLILIPPKFSFGRPSKKEYSGGYYVRNVPRTPLEGKKAPFEAPYYVEVGKSKIPKS